MSEYEISHKKKKCIVIYDWEEYYKRFDNSQLHTIQGCCVEGSPLRQ